MSKNKDKTFILNFNEFKKPKNLALSGMLIALYLVVYSLNIQITPLIQLRFGFIVLAIAGFIGGPLMGLSVGVVADILSMVLLSAKGGGSFFFGFTLSYGLLGLMSGLIFYNGKLNLVRVSLAVACEFLISIFLNTYWLSILYGTAYKPLFVSRLPKTLIMLVVNTAMLYAFMKTMSVAIKRLVYSTS